MTGEKRKIYSCSSNSSINSLQFNSDDTEPLSTEEQAVLVAIDPVNERLYARTPSNASPVRADTPIPDFNANNDEQPDYENDTNDKIDENEPNTMVNIHTIQNYDSLVSCLLMYCHVLLQISYNHLALQ